jgi:hypothetical protein
MVALSIEKRAGASDGHRRRQSAKPARPMPNRSSDEPASGTESAALRRSSIQQVS